MAVGAEVVVVVVVADDELGEGQGVFPIELSVNFGGGVDAVNQVLAGCYMDGSRRGVGSAVLERNVNVVADLDDLERLVDTSGFIDDVADVELVARTKPSANACQEYEDVSLFHGSYSIFD